MDAIQAEFARIEKLYKDLPKNRHELLRPLMQNAAYMRVTLEEMQKSGNSIAHYNSMLKNYNMVIKHLEEALPETEAEDKLARLLDA